jgi:hypothetical protein
MRLIPRLASSARHLIGREQRPRKQFAIVLLVEPGTFNVEQLETWHPPGECQGVDRDLRDRLIGAGIRLVVEDIRSAHQDRCDGRHKTVDSPVGEAGLVGGDIVDGVRCRLGRIEDDVEDSRNGRYGISAGWGLITRSLRLDVCRPDHLAPLLGLFCEVLTEIGGRHRHGHIA